MNLLMSVGKDIVNIHNWYKYIKNEFVDGIEICTKEDFYKIAKNIYPKTFQIHAENLNDKNEDEIKELFEIYEKPSSLYNKKTLVNIHKSKNIVYEISSDYNIELVTENCENETSIDYIGNENKFCWDVCHDAYNGIIDFTLEASQVDNLTNVHLSDVYENDTHHQFNKNKDIINYKNIIKYLKNINYNKSIVLEIYINNFTGTIEEKMEKYLYQFKLIKEVI